MMAYDYIAVVLVLVCIHFYCSVANYTCHSTTKGYKSLKSGTFIPLMHYGVLQCFRECLLRPKCNVMSLTVAELDCKLSEYTLKNYETPIYVSSERPDLIFLQESLLLGRCVNHTCEEGERCVVLSSGRKVCVISECPDLEHEIVALGTSKAHRYVGTVIKYACETGFMMFHTSTITCLTNGSWPESRCIKCPRNYTSIAKSDFCYFLPPYEKNYTGAVQSCYDEGGSLMQINSVKKLEKLLNNIEKFTSDNLLIDGRDSYSNGVYEFSDGTHMSVSLPSNPVASTVGTIPETRLDCLMLSKHHSLGLISSDCDILIPFICEVTVDE